MHIITLFRKDFIRRNSLFDTIAEIIMMSPHFFVMKRKNVRMVNDNCRNGGNLKHQLKICQLLFPKSEEKVV